MVGEDDRAELVRRQRDELGGFPCGQIPDGRFLLCDLIHAGLQPAQHDLAVFVRLLRGQRRAVGLLDLEHRAVEVFAGIGVLRHDAKVGFHIIGDDELAHLSPEELHMELCLIQHIAVRGGLLLHGVNAGL